MESRDVSVTFWRIWVKSFFFQQRFFDVDTSSFIHFAKKAQ